MAPIHDAARDRDVETLRRLLAEGVSPDAVDVRIAGRLFMTCAAGDSPAIAGVIPRPASSSFATLGQIWTRSLVEVTHHFTFRFTS
jgi:hypothetical protein